MPVAGMIAVSIGYRSGTNDWPRQAGVLALVIARFAEMITSAMMVIR
jgi:hypothetical protein